jgi:hypothetical protein
MVVIRNLLETNYRFIFSEWLETEGFSIDQTEISAHDGFYCFDYFLELRHMPWICFEYYAIQVLTTLEWFPCLLAISVTNFTTK